MSFPHYRRYKDSGIEWLGEMPWHWDAKRLKYLCRVRTGDKDTAEAIDDGAYPFFVRSQIAERIDSYSFDGEAVLTAGDGVGVGKVFHYINGKFDFHQRVYMMSNFRFVSGRYFYWYLSSMFATVALEGRAKSTVDSLRMPVFMNFVFTVPPPEEQVAIVAFLDTKTKKIDLLIREQLKLLELLKEKRRATISTAVVKGITPDVAMKSSGTQFIGRVPEHWSVEPLKYSIGKIEQGWSPQCENGPALEDEWGVLKVGSVNGDRFCAEEQKALPTDVTPLKEYEIRAGDILMSRGNTLELVGLASYISDVRARLLLCDLLYRFRAIPEHADGRFLVLALRSPYVRSQIEGAATGASSSMKKVGQETLKKIVMALPPVNEQRNIVDWCSSECTEIDSLIDELKSVITLLEERRASLISAAVTGKIDVRGFSDVTTSPKRVGAA